MSKNGSVKLINTNIDNTKRIKAFKNTSKPKKKVLLPKGERSEFSLSIILAIFIAIFIIAVARVLLGSAPLTFRGFLDSLINCPTIDISTNIIDFTIAGSWGVFDFLRVFINGISQVLNTSVFIIGLLINLLLVILWVVGFLFGF